MPTLREWRSQAQAGVLDPLYVEHLRRRRKVRGSRGRRVRWMARATRLNYRAKQANGVGRVNAEDLIMLVLSYGSRCAYCGWALDFEAQQNKVLVGCRRGTFDHVRPLSRGGRGDVGNLAPACGPCNLERSRWPDSALGIPAPHRFVLD